MFNHHNDKHAQSEPHTGSVPTDVSGLAVTETSSICAVTPGSAEPPTRTPLTGRVPVIEMYEQVRKRCEAGV